MSRFININMNIGNARMTYIVKQRKYVMCIIKHHWIQIKPSLALGSSKTVIELCT